jgi:hypothetical protein
MNTTLLQATNNRKMGILASCGRTHTTKHAENASSGSGWAYASNQTRHILSSITTPSKILWGDFLALSF